MKILHIITRLILGGAQKNTVLCARDQVQRGHDVAVAFGPIYGPEGSLLDEATDGGVRPIEVAAMCRAISPWRDWRCYCSLRELIRRERPDVVHTHSSKAGIVGRAAAWAEQVPAVIHTIHGLPFHDRQPRFVHHTYVQLERWAARRCHKLVGITQAMVDAFAQHRIGEARQFVVVPSGVEPGAFASAPSLRAAARRAYGIADDAPVIGIVARLDPLKGQHDLLDVLPRIRQRFAKVRLLLVGDGWIRDELERRVAREGLESSVIFAGLVPPGQVPSLLGAMDVMALPSYQEGQGRTLVEALLGGCAVVGYDAGGIAEVCIDGQTGRLVGVGDRQGLGDALLGMLEHPDERRRLADQGRRHVLAHFTAQVMFDRLDALYQQTLKEAGRS